MGVAQLKTGDYMPMQTISVNLTNKDIDSIESIKKDYKVDSWNQAIRILIREKIELINGE